MKLSSNIKILVASAFALTGGSNAATIQFDYDIEDFGDVASNIVTETFSLPEVGSINSVSVELSHSYHGDIVFGMVGPDGDVYNFLAQNGGGGSDFGDGTEFLTGLETYTFVESGSGALATDADPIPGGTYDALAWGDGSVAGDWTMTLDDSFNADDGAIGSIVIDYTPAAIPEPSTSLLGGLAALALLRRRRK